MICYVLVCIAVLIVAVVEINQWARENGALDRNRALANTIGFLLGVLSGVLATVMILGGNL
jgi:hypothetical protein